MSNEIQKLKPVERSLYRRVFMARIEGGQSPEAAHRHGLNAVKMWNEVGAFNEEPSNTSLASAVFEKHTRLAEGFEAVFDWYHDESAVEIDPTKDLMRMYRDEEIGLRDFRRRLGLDRESSG